MPIEISNLIIVLYLQTFAYLAVVCEEKVSKKQNIDSVTFVSAKLFLNIWTQICILISSKHNVHLAILPKKCNDGFAIAIRALLFSFF